MAVWKIKERYELSRANDNRPNRAIEMAGFEPSHTKNGSSILMASSSNSTDFGDLTNNRTLFGGMTASNQTRALFYGGEVPGSNSNEIDSIQLATEGNASDHGDLTTAVGYAAATSNGTRALVAGGNTVINVIGFGSIAQTGNFADFGDLAESRNALVGICSPTRAIFAGGTDGTSPSPAYSTRIDFVTINSTGNASDFGDLTGNSGYMATCQDKTRAFFIGGATGGNSSKNNEATDFITFATTGNAQEFGNLTQLTRNSASATDGRSGFTMAGANPSNNNVIQRFDMASLGNMVDYSDINVSKADNKGACGSHDGIDYDGLHPQLPSVTYMPGSGRWFFAGYHNPGHNVSIDLIHIPTLGNSSDFGDLSEARGRAGAAASKTRLVIGGGEKSPGVTTDVIDSIEMSSRGNSADFGDESGPYNSQKTGLSNQTRGVFGGGFASPNWSNVIDYVTIATAGNATDFGNLSETKASMGSVSSSTRGVFMGGRTPTNQDEIEYITIASTGDVTDFGDLVDVKSVGAGASSGVRGLHGGGLNPGDSAGINVIEFITIASTGNGTDFGDLTRSNYLVSATTNSTRAVFGGGLTPNVNTMDFVTIATTGNATDYGDLITASSGRANGSNADSHGGLQG